MFSIPENVRQTEHSHRGHKIFDSRGRGFRHGKRAKLQLLNTLSLRSQHRSGMDLHRQRSVGNFLQPVLHRHHRLVNRMRGRQIMAQYQNARIGLFLVPLKKRKPNRGH